MARPRTFPQHTLPLLPLLRSRPGGVHKACVVRSPGSDKKLNRRLSMREHSQQTVDAEMKQRVRDYRNYNRQEQRVTTVRARTRDNALKRQVKRVADRDNKLHKPSAAAGRHQSQEKTHPEESVDYPENVIDNLRDARKRSRTLDFALRVDNLVNRFRSKLAGNLIDLLGFVRCGLGCGTFTDFRLDFAVNLALYRVVLGRASCFFDG